MVRSVHRVARYVKIHIGCNILVCRKLYSQRCQILQLLLKFLKCYFYLLGAKGTLLFRS